MIYIHMVVAAQIFDAHHHLGPIINYSSNITTFGPTGNAGLSRRVYLLV
jgi:hypothetical protein